jgi:membrane fusion protein (multidrug efflux system)
MIRLNHRHLPLNLSGLLETALPLSRSQNHSSTPILILMKRYIIGAAAIGCLITISGGLIALKVPQFKAMEASSAAQQMPPMAVATVQATSESWNPLLPAVGSMVAENGIILRAEASGVLTAIQFESGAKVAKGAILAQLDVTLEQAQLRSAEAGVELARLNAERVRELRSRETLSQSDLDTVEAQLTQAIAGAEQIRAAIEKKTFRAPFAGTAGIRRANLGQYLNGGDQLVSLQALDPIHVDFSLPQQRLTEITTGLPVRVRTDAAPDRVFEGRITAIDTKVDPQTRNLQLRATLSNNDELLRPGMFAKVEIVLPAGAPQVVVPVTAINYSTSGNTVFVIDTTNNNGPGGTSMHTVRQQLVRLGANRGDFVAILSGLKAGEQVVVQGGFKLRNGASVIINNSLLPKPELEPKPANS